MNASHSLPAENAPFLILICPSKKQQITGTALQTTEFDCGVGSICVFSTLMGRTYIFHINDNNNYIEKIFVSKPKAYILLEQI